MSFANSCIKCLTFSYIVCYNDSRVERHTKEQDEMSKQEIAKAIAELMNAYDTMRAKWIDAFGSDEGFDAWFTEKVPSLQ